MAYGMDPSLRTSALAWAGKMGGEFTLIETDISAKTAAYMVKLGLFEKLAPGKYRLTELGRTRKPAVNWQRYFA